VQTEGLRSLMCPSPKAEKQESEQKNITHTHTHTHTNERPAIVNVPLVHEEKKERVGKKEQNTDKIKQSGIDVSEFPGKARFYFQIRLSRPSGVPSHTFTY